MEKRIIDKKAIPNKPCKSCKYYYQRYYEKQYLIHYCDMFGCSIYHLFKDKKEPYNCLYNET